MAEALMTTSSFVAVRVLTEYCRANLGIRLRSRMWAATTMRGKFGSEFET